MHNLHPDLQAEIREAFFNLAGGAARYAEFQKTEPPASKSMPITDQEHGQAICDVDAASGVSCACR